jgi:hypothetical protein
MKRPALIKLKANGIDFETVEKNIIVINWICDILCQKKQNQILWEMSLLKRLL